MGEASARPAVWAIAPVLIYFLYNELPKHAIFDPFAWADSRRSICLRAIKAANIRP